MKKAMVFNWEEFEELVWEVSLNTMSLIDDYDDGWSFGIRNFEDYEWDEWINKYGEDAEDKLDGLGGDDDRFIYRMIGNKFGMVVADIVGQVGKYKDTKFAVIFE